MSHVAVLGSILALALGLVSLALMARLPRREATRGVSWLPITLLLYNLWVAGFLATGYLEDRLRPGAESGQIPPPIGASRLALLALALAWLYAHVAQIRAFLGVEPTRRTAVPRTLAGLGVALVAGWLLSSWSGNATVFSYLGALVSLAVFPAALVASVYFYLRSRRLEEATSRRGLSRLALAYVGLFVCLFALSISWGRLAAVSRDLPIAIDVSLELLYNVVAIVWVARVPAWGGAASMVQPPLPATSGHDRARLLAEYGITKREAEIVELICEGKTNQEIADQLFISVTTVKDHNYVTYQKLGVRNRTELTRLVLGAVRTPPK